MIDKLNRNVYTTAQGSLDVIEGYEYINIEFGNAICMEKLQGELTVRRDMRRQSEVEN